MIVLILIFLIFLVAVWDVFYRKVPNFLVLMILFLGFGFKFSAWDFNSILLTFYGIFVGMAIFIPGYLFGVTGAGDVKLMAAIGTFLGPYDVFIAAMTSIGVGSVIALGYAVSSLFNQENISPWSRYGLMFKTLVTTGRPIYIAPAEGEVMGRKFPFAVSIAIGTTLFLVWDSQLLTLAGLAK